MKVQFKQGEEALYWVKKHSNKPDSDSAEQEYNFLRSAHSQFSGISHLTVLKPIAYLESFDTLVTEHCDGEHLSSLVKRRVNRFSAVMKTDQQIKRYFHMCGQWLAKLHEEQLPSDQYYTWEQLFEYINIRLKRLISEWGLEAAYYERILTYLDKKRSELPSEIFVRVKTHGDYAPYNIFGFR